MSLFHRFVSSLVVFSPVLAFAVYAPVPEQEQGKALVVRVGAGVYHDSNIFGGATGEIDSWVYSLTPSLSYNASVTDQTFVSASYDLTNDHVADRPGKKNLTSHTLALRVAHAFAQDTSIDVSNRYQISKNPQSLLQGVALNTDQSFKMNEFNARYVTAANEKAGLVFKYRNLALNYDTVALGAQLDRIDQLAGLEINFAVLPETKLVAEYRYLDVAYDSGSTLKDKQSNYLLAGVDYQPGEKLTFSGRAGFEDRSRAGSTNTTSPTAELSARYAYGENSFLAGGYSYALEESSDVVRFTDSKVNRFFVNVQQRVSALVSASGSLTYEPSQLQGRGTQRDLDEKVTRFGLALSWTPLSTLVVSATLDVDHVSSDDVSREQDRSRYGVSARYSF